MVKRRAPEKTIAPEYVLGKDLDLADLRGELLARSHSGRLECIVGYRRKDQPWDLAYFHPSVGIREGAAKAPGRFIDLDRGMLRESVFISPDTYYKIIKDRWIVFPSGASSYFGVIKESDRTEDVELTREIFGATLQEIEEVARAFSKIIGRGYHEMVRLPRSTFSKTQSNDCDLTQALIPRNFPYLAFEQAQYAWSHISFYGFYRLLSFVCGGADSSPIARAMVESGVEPQILRRLIDNAQVYGPPLIVKRY